MHPRHAPAHLAWHKGGDGVSLCNGLKSWGPINGKWNFRSSGLAVGRAKKRQMENLLLHGHI
eukprot:1018770-Karenia_brevis.AAC.1